MVEEIPDREKIGSHSKTYTATVIWRSLAATSSSMRVRSGIHVRTGLSRASAPSSMRRARN
jgi:hypothetical protein